jgi:hypothetical protein
MTIRSRRGEESACQPPTKKASGIKNWPSGLSTLVRPNKIDTVVGLWIIPPAPLFLPPLGRPPYLLVEANHVHGGR